MLNPPLKYSIANMCNGLLQLEFLAFCDISRTHFFQVQYQKTHQFHYQQNMKCKMLVMVDTILFYNDVINLLSSPEELLFSSNTCSSNTWCTIQQSFTLQKLRSTITTDRCELKPSLISRRSGFANYDNIFSVSKQASLLHSMNVFSNIYDQRVYQQMNMPVSWLL